MRKGIFFLLLTSTLFANTILDLYRQKGLDATQKELDKELTQKSYWKSVINKSDTSFGYIEGYNSLLICDKNSSTLKLYQKDNNGKFILKNEYNAFTGKNKGEKQYEGDLKTPVGIYNLVKKLSKVDSFYGPLAFVTSYPNLYDRYQNKKGHGIWIHGLPLHQKRDTFTKGCIAIDNDSIKCLSQEIDMSRTVLLIFENKEIIKNQKKELITLASWLYKWRNAWKYNDIDTYLSFYAKDFKRANGMDIEDFSNYKRAIFLRKQKKEIIFKDINIIPYPNHPDIFQITFYEKYQTPEYTFNGQKEILVKKENKTYKIFSEK
ncbi:putative periplasmic protein [hydrothermal vent metagenome]|uniref:Putative periplasmic protein n=1 Tax=hydrothermal vent metagenome TaxID=652676 RepID=A0A1W1B9G7_9ZZZZ